MDGFEATGRLKRLFTGAGVRVPPIVAPGACGMASIVGGLAVTDAAVPRL